MSRYITVGVDGSPESRAAAEWAAREAALRGVPLKLVHVWEPVPAPMAQAPLLGAETQAHWTERVPREVAQGLRERHPGVEVSTEQLSGTPGDMLVAAAQDADLLVVGSRGLSGLGGFLIGSVGLSVVAHSERPVVVVRAGEQAADQPAGAPSAADPARPVVVGVDTDHPHDAVIAFAFEEAARRDTGVRVVSGWNLPPYYVYGLAGGVDVHDEVARARAAALADVLAPWRRKYPAVDVVEVSRTGSPSNHLVDASREACLVVVGRKVRRNPFGTHIGPVAHAVMHHSVAPVAVVAHD